MVKLDLQLFAKNKVTDSIVNDVIRGKYGNGDARKTALANAGYDYKEVQAAVNQKLKGGTSGTTTTPPSTKPANTPTTTNTGNDLKGINDSNRHLVDKANSSFTVSDSVKELEQGKNDAIGKYNEHINTDIIDPSIYEGLQQQWNGGSETIQQANAYIQSQLGWLQNGGKTQWSDKYSAAIDKYLNREEFVYDVDHDPLFQQALASAMNSGKTAMQDTIGQASALTGGYGSTYATSAGNQAYNSFIEDAYNNLPQYYQMALSAYEAEGQDLYNQVAMLGQADQTEYNKGVDALTATSNWRNQLYGEEYSAFRDHKTDLYNIGNLQATEWDAKANAFYNSYNISSNEYEGAYKKEWDSWQQDVNNAMEWIGIYNTDAWKQEEYNQTESWNQKNFGLEQNKYKVSTGDTNMDGVLSPEEIATMNTTYFYDSDGKVVKGTASDKNAIYTTDENGNRVAVDVDSIPKDVKTKASKFKDDDDGLSNYLAEQEKLGNISTEQGDYLYEYYASNTKDNSSTQAPANIDEWTVDDWKSATFTKVEDTINWFWGDDDDEVIVNGNVYSINTIRTKMKNAGVDEKTRTLIYDKLKDLDTDKKYTFLKKK